MSDVTIIPANPFEDGKTAGKTLGKTGVSKAITATLKDKLLKDNLGAMSRATLDAYVVSRLETEPDYTRYPELQDIYPERLDYLKGFTEGAQCTLTEAAVHDYVVYRQFIDNWWSSLNPTKEPGHCSGIIMVGPDGVLGAHSAESTPEPMPRNYKHRKPKPYKGIKQNKTQFEKITVIKPRTGYIENWGLTNETGLGGVAGTSCSTWLDEPIEDTWPIKNVPLLRFARDVPALAELWQRYHLFNWSRASTMYADVQGNGVAVELSFRRIGVRHNEGAPAVWCTEGHFETDHMNSYIRRKRLEYLKKFDQHAGADDMQYATDCAVRFCHIGELCNEPWGHGMEHMRRVVTDHAPFPRAVCRHGGPDTDSYDETITMASNIYNLTANRVHSRGYIPWKKFCCEVPEDVTQYPPRPFGY